MSAKEEKVESPIIHDAFKNFVSDLNKAVHDRNLYDTTILYDRDWNDLTERFYKASPLPKAEDIGELVENDEYFMLIYKELFFRHVHQKLGPSVENRFESFHNYVELFNLVLGMPSKDPDIDLPIQWSWDMIDEFIFQFQSFHEFRTNIHMARLSPSDLAMVRDHEHVWSAQSVIRYLHALAKKGGVDLAKNWNRKPTGKEVKADKGADVAPLFTTLSHFSLIGLCRVYCLLGDYVSAIKVLDSIDLTSKGSPFHLAVAAKVTLYYFMGFAYMMLRRYADAFKTFSYFLVYHNRRAHALPRSYQREVIGKKIEKMYGLLALVNQLSPQNLDESVAGSVRDRRKKTPEQLFEESCPKFISPCSPNYADLSSRTGEVHEALDLQKRIFLNEFKQRMDIPDLYTYLKMCTNVHLSKLGKFLSKSEEETTVTLLKLKHKTRNLRWSGASPSSGKWVSAAEVDFVVDKDVVHIRESRAERPYADFFIRNILKYQDMIDDLST